MVYIPMVCIPKIGSWNDILFTSPSMFLTVPRSTRLSRLSLAQHQVEGLATYPTWGTPLPVVPRWSFHGHNGEGNKKWQFMVYKPWENHRKMAVYSISLWFMVFITFYNELVTGANLNQQTYLMGASHYGFCCQRYSTRPGKQIVCYWKWWLIVDFPIKSGDTLSDTDTMIWLVVR